METNNPYVCTGHTPIPNNSGLKQLPQSVEPAYTKSTLVSFAQQGKGLNGEMPVNGLISSVSTDIHGTFTSDSTTLRSTSNKYDYLWNFPKSPVHKDCNGPAPYLSNGSKIHMSNGPFSKVTSQEIWENGTSSHSASLSCSKQDLSNVSDQNVKTASAPANEKHHDVSETSCSVPVVESSVETFSPTQSKRKQMEDENFISGDVLRNDPVLAENVEQSDSPTNDQICEYNGTDQEQSLLRQTVSRPLSPPDVSSVDDTSQPSVQFDDSILPMSDSLEPFGADLPQDDQICEYNGTDQEQSLLRQTVSRPLSPPDVSSVDDTSQPSVQFDDSILPMSDSLEPFGADLPQGRSSNSLYELEELQAKLKDCIPLKEVSAISGSVYSSSTFTTVNATSFSVLGDSVMQDSQSALDSGTEGGKAEEQNPANGVPEVNEGSRGSASKGSNIAETNKSNSDQGSDGSRTDESNIAETNKSKSDRGSDGSRTDESNIAETNKSNSDKASDGSRTDESNIAETNKSNSDKASDGSRTDESNIAETNKSVDEDSVERKAKEPSNKYGSAPEKSIDSEDPDTSSCCVTELDEDAGGSRVEKQNSGYYKKMDDGSLNAVITENTYPESSTVHEPEQEEFKPREERGNFHRRRIATPEEVRHPILHGWKREVRIKKTNSRWRGETWYYAPCGKRMKQFPEVIKYLSRNPSPVVRREHFSFSPRMPVGDYYEERNTAEGIQWIQLSSEEIPSRILAITGKRGRPRNLEKAKAKENKVKRGRGRPPKARMIHLLNKPDAKLLKKLENKMENQEILSDEEKLQLRKLKKKMRRKARNLEAKQEAAKKAKIKKSKEEKQKVSEQAHNTEKGKIKQKLKEKTNISAHKSDRKLLAQQRRLEERKRQQFMLDELKKPTEDMCLSDHQPLPEFPCVPGVILPSDAFSDCLTTVEFLHTYGKVLGLDATKDVPSLYTLQEGLLNVGDSFGEVQDLLVKLLRAAMTDPGLPPYCQYLKILGEKVAEISLNRDSVSEILRLFLNAYGGDIDLCESLRTHPFHAHPPHIKAAVLVFLVNELNGSTLIINEMEQTLENMSHYRKNKWIIEGKIRRLKFALAKKSGKPNTPVPSLAEGRRRRSERHPEETGEIDGDDGLLQKTAIDEEEDVSSCLSVGELESQIEKLTKRHLFFRKKLLSSSQKLRFVSLGQDRYHRVYWMLPHLGGIFVEGTHGTNGQTQENLLTETSLLSSIKTEDIKETDEKPFNTPNRSRGRPRKSRSEPHHHCILHQCSDSWNDTMNDIDLNSRSSPSSEFQNLNSAVLTPENSPPHSESTAKLPTEESQWCQLIPSTPFSDPLQETPANPSNFLPPNSSAVQAVTCKGEEQYPAVSGATPCLACTNFRRSSIPHHEKPLDSNTVCDSGQKKHRGRPPSKVLKQIEEKYFSQLTKRPVPADMRQKWWWIKDSAILESLLKTLHPRGIREKNLHKHLTKHLEHLKEMCFRPASDSIFEFIPTDGQPVSHETVEKWSVTDWTFRADMSILQWVENLEQRIFLSDLQQRGWTPPSLDSARNDLKHFEYQLDAFDDILVKVKKEEGSSQRDTANPLDLAVLRLLELEQNVERRYLKEPLWLLSEVQHEKVLLTDLEDPLSTTEIEYTFTPRMRLWRQTVDRCRSAAQLSLCLQQLEKSLAWERSVTKVTCLICHKGDNDEHLLLCDNCDRGCHTYCHRPQITEIPEGDWFCPACVALQKGCEFFQSSGSSRRHKKCRIGFQESNNSPKASKRRDNSAVCLHASPEGPLSKRRRIATRSRSPDLTFCEIILMEMESHDEAWPFLEPVNPRLVPGYRKIIKNPMDFSTMRQKLLNGKYSSCDEFAEDAELVFSNCQLFNEDESEVGRAGLIMKQFYESRWEELCQGRNQDAL
ncbi:bromodomain adjacent to zinc finger domain protein 2A [Bombina bombina]|uniref:bromodomain adjacent to zinc finger domain protein 2A n=1 Tax=Bombina bombina TaxID=8345 RepID=UPI00235B216D|nr:bromodomain adjacent to zinc finger domain protein 2A [Bombina bombina]